MSLTDRQSAVLAWIAFYIAENGWAPTIREIGVGLGIRSPEGVQSHLRALEKKGRIARQPGTARAIRVIDASPLDKETDCTESEPVAK